MTEIGFPDSDSEKLNMLMAPAGTPQPIVSWLERASIVILVHQEVLDIMRKGGYTVIGKGGEAARSHIARKVPMCKEMVEIASVKVD